MNSAYRAGRPPVRLPWFCNFSGSIGRRRFKSSYCGRGIRRS